MRTTSLRRCFILCLALSTSFAVLRAEDRKEKKEEQGKEKKKEIVPPASFKEGSLHLSGFGGTPGDRSSFTVELLPDGTLHVVTKRFRQTRADRKVQLTEKRTKEFYEAMVKIVSETDLEKRGGGAMDGWYVTATIKLEEGEKKLGYSGFLDVEDISREFRIISDLIKKEIPLISFPE